MLWCWRWSPLLTVAALVLHTSGWVEVPRMASAAAPGGLVATTNTVLAQFFAWLFLLLALTAVWRVLTTVTAEIRLRRLYDRADRPIPGPTHRPGHPL